MEQSICDVVERATLRTLFAWAALIFFVRLNGALRWKMSPEQRSFALRFGVMDALTWSAERKELL